MGEQIHVGGENETDRLAEKANISEKLSILDVCSALGGPARHLARKYKCKFTGLDATQKMIDEAIKRTEKENLSEMWYRKRIPPGMASLISGKSLMKYPL